MSKLDVNIINNIKMLGLDMIEEAGSGDVGLTLSSAQIFYSLFMENLNFDYHNMNFINRDRVVVSNRLLPLMYATLHMFYKDFSLDNLREFKKLNSLTSGYANIKTPGIEIGSILPGDVSATSVGIALGERYLESLLKIEEPKSKLIDFHTICICTEEELMTGMSYESTSFASLMNLNKLIYIIIKDGIAKDSGIKETFNEDLVDRFISLNYNVEEINGNSISSIKGAIEDAYVSKKPTVIVVNTIYAKDSDREGLNKYFNTPLNSNEMNNLRVKYNLTMPFEVKEEYRKEIEKNLDKRLGKKLLNYDEEYKESIADLKIKEIMEFLQNREVNIKFIPENIKINDGYEESLLISNHKILNIVASKSPFVLVGSNDNFISSKSTIAKSKIMSKEEPTGRNILFGKRTEAMGGIACGLASLGFKIFISSPLVDAALLNPFIKLSAINNLNVNYIFTQDTFLNTYEKSGNSATYELNLLRLIPDLITIRPADINEILGTYELLSNYSKPTALIIGSEKVKKLQGTNYKYLVAGAYRVKKEREYANAIIIATGSEVELALKIVDELAPYGIDFRVVTMPSCELYEMQKEKYQNVLLPKEIKTFVLEYGNKLVLSKYATSEEYVLGTSGYSDSGTKEELLNYHGLSINQIKAKIMELMKK